MDQDLAVGLTGAFLCTQEAFRLLAPSLPANGRDQNIALVDIGAHVTHFYVLRNGQFLFARDQAFGGNQLTHDIQRAFNLSPDEAESAKKNQGLPENYDSDVLQPFMETLALEITRALQFFFTSTSYSQVDQVVLAGGCALLPGLDELIGKRAGGAGSTPDGMMLMRPSRSITWTSSRSRTSVPTRWYKFCSVRTSPTRSPRQPTSSSSCRSARRSSTPASNTCAAWATDPSTCHCRRWCASPRASHTDGSKDRSGSVAS